MVALNIKGYHIDNITKKPIKQRKISRSQQIEAAQSEWKNEAEQLAA